MKNTYHDIRAEYLHGKLDDESVDRDPFNQFNKWMEEAIKAGVLHPTSMILATAGKDGQPSCRIVLLKEVTNAGFVFFTNYKSHKGMQLAENPKAAITFFWMELERQVRIEGIVSKVGPEVSDEYFRSRPWESRLSAAVSPQSSIINGRMELEKAKQRMREQYPEQNIPRPDEWGGYIVKPHFFEFWQGRESRLHDRIIYSNPDAGWIIQRLAP